MDVKNDLDGKMAVLFKELSKALTEYLQAVLPKLQAARWWDDLVVRNLSRQQSDHLKRSSEQTLASLDLAALLRVFDANWWELSQKNSLPPDCRNYLKEMQSIRNRWAHSNALSESTELVYRDIDTAQRLLTAIAPENHTIDALSNLKQEILGLNSPRSRPDNTAPVVEPCSEHTYNLDSSFSIGQIVRMRSDPEKSGAVVGISKAEPEYRYEVFVNGEKRTFYASQLLPEAVSPAECSKVAEADAFQARLSALQIARPGGTTLFSLNAARVDFIPYQFRPVIKFMHAERPRLLIADSVGVGKTIEAGLILRELQARREMQNVLIVCPKPLVAERKWQSEMRRFDERFVHLDGRGLRHCIEETDLEGQWDPQHPRVIIPYSLFDEKLLHGAQGRTKRKGLLDLDPPPRFDMVIVDEAHHIRNPNTFGHQGVRFFCDHAEAVLFMTATPLQMGDHDLFVLLRALRPDLVIDQASYEEMAAPNPAINRAVSLARGAGQNWQEEAQAALAEAAGTAWGRAVYPSDPAYIKTNEILNDASITDQKRVAAISTLEALHSFAGIINRTRRRDIGDFTIRKPRTLSVDFTEAQRELHDSLLAVQARILSLLHGNTCIAFMMSTIRRQAASCIFGLAPMIKDILTRRLDELGIEDCDYEEGPGDQAKNTLAKEIASVTEQAASLPPDDPKLNAFLDVIKDKQDATNLRIMVFSTFRHTLRYLEGKLRACEVRVGLIHGDVGDEERRELRRRFKMPSEAREAIDVLLFSEVGCEGLDYQFCDTLVNYDLPWNPMRIEQRIGRLDRNGQKSESIAIYNLITPGTVDADIYDRCLMRIGVFESSVGECEEILGELTQEIRKIADDLQLTVSERQRKFQQIADNKIRLANESTELEKNQKEFFGLDLSDQQFREEVERSSSPWLSPRSLENLVALYLQSLTESDASAILGNKSIQSLRLSQSMRSALLSDLESLNLPATEAVRRWRKRLKEDEIHSKITFEAAAATQDPDADLLSPLHPLVQQAARKLCCSASDCRTALMTSHPALAAGIHPFVIYEWRYEGVRRDVVLVPISSSDANGPAFNEALAQAVTWPIEPSQFPEKDSFESLESKHYEIWSQARNAHQEETKTLADHRLRSLETSHNARMALLKEQLEQATDEKIRRMRQSQISAAMADYEKRHSEISSGLEKADVHAEPIAWGVLKAEGSDGI